MEALDAFFAMARAVLTVAKSFLVFWLNWDWQMQLISIAFTFAIVQFFRMCFQQESASENFNWLREQGATPAQAAMKSKYFTAGCIPLLLGLAAMGFLFWFLARYGTGEGTILRGS